MNKKIFFKVLKVISINLIVIFIVFNIINWIVYRYFYFPVNNMEYSPKIYPYRIQKHLLDDKTRERFYPLRKFVGIDEGYKKKAIIMFGCSYGYGHKIEDKDTFHYKLSHILKRPFYNYSSSGESTQFALMDIQSHKLDDVIKNSDYCILVTIGEHSWRIHTASNGYHFDYVWPRYDIKNGKLVFHKPKSKIIEGSYIYKFLQKKYYAKYLVSNKSQQVQDYLFDCMKLHYETIGNELHKINPKIKVIIIVYQDSIDNDSFIFNPRWKELEDEGFIVVNVKNHLPFLRDIDYVISETDGHPSSKAWDAIIDLMVNKLKVID